MKNVASMDFLTAEDPERVQTLCRELKTRAALPSRSGQDYRAEYRAHQLGARSRSG